MILLNLKNLYGRKLHATDGKIGHVQDFYFDDKNWTVRYVIADTGNWLAGRQVLLSPHVFGHLDQMEKALLVNLTRNQIENAPSIELHKPVSRQYEEDYHRYYGWPCYWQGGGLWGPSAFPFLGIPGETHPLVSDTTCPPPHQLTDTHLRSALAVDGYRLEANDGHIGHVCGFMMDPGTWEISRLVIKTGSWLAGHEVEMPTGKIGRISYDESTVFVNLTSKDVEHSPAHHPVLAGAANGR